MTVADIRILRFSKADQETWKNFLGQLDRELQDLHFTPEYIDIYRKTYHQDGAAIYYKCDSLEILQLVVIKKIDRLAGNEDGGFEKDHFDIESPYGFGGAISNRDISDQERVNYDTTRREFLIAEGFVTEFISIHPMLAKQAKILVPPNANLALKKECAYIDLTKDHVEIWKNIEDRQRKAITAARKRSVLIKKEDLGCSSIRKFHELYLSTMCSVGASVNWRFPVEYFINTRDLLGPENVSLFSAYVGKDQAASFLLIHSGDACYYHFSCSDPKFNRFNCNHLLMFDLILWAKAKKFKTFFLGGGYSDNGDDSLYKFKQSFSNDKVGLIQAREVINDAVYSSLALERGIDISKLEGVAEQYFPIYRANA